MNQDDSVEALVGARLLGQRERDRIRRAHHALVAAGPLPELPASLHDAPRVGVRRLPALKHPRSRHVLAAFATATVLVAGGAGYFLSHRAAEPSSRLVAMRATAAAPGARAMLRIGARDRAGNASITLRVRGLPELPRDSQYRMYLTDRDRIVALCGSFRTDGGETVVRFDVPYSFGEYNGWLIRREHDGRQQSPPLLTSET